MFIKQISTLSIPLNKNELKKIKKSALRNGVWFKVLSKLERIQIDLTITVVANEVRSSVLTKLLHPIVTKLLSAMEGQTKRLMRSAGINLARKMSEIGKRLGCKSAESWANDQEFIQFLTISYMNIPHLHKILLEEDKTFTPKNADN